MAECSICLEIMGKHNIVSPVIREYITCKNKSCTAVFCPECMALYINISMKENQIPKCHNINCGRYYLMSDI